MTLFFICFTFLSINCIAFYFFGSNCLLCKFYNDVFKIFSLRKLDKPNNEITDSNKLKLYDNLRLLEFISSYEQYLNTRNLFNTETYSGKLISENQYTKEKTKYLNKIENLYSIKYSTQKMVLNSAKEIKFNSKKKVISLNI